MATIELGFLNSGSKEYQEPDEGELIHLSKEAWKTVCLLSYHRVRIIEKAGVIIELIQDDVLRYPPVQVQVSRDPESVQAYIDMLKPGERPSLDSRHEN